MRSQGSGGRDIQANKLPKALESLEDIRAKIGNRLPVFFLDFDGTLAPIAATPDLATLPEKCEEILLALSHRYLVCLISGRDLDDLKRKAPAPEAYYAGDHGYRVLGPEGSNIEHEVAPEAKATIAEAAEYARQLFSSVEGVIVESKTLSLSIHFRLVPPRRHSAVRRRAAEILARFQGLRQTGGRLVVEFLPVQVWNKGEAMRWLLERLGHSQDATCPICLGDDLTDEDAFAVAQGWGVSVVVGPTERRSHADYMLRNTTEAAEFLDSFV